jgi:recombinational DNA repair ATPase RecF
MLSKEGFKDYLAVCKKRRKLVHYIKGSEELIATIDGRIGAHSAALEELRAQTFESFRKDVPLIQSYRDFLVLLDDTIALHTAAINDKTKVKHFIKGLKEKLSPYEAFIKSVKVRNKGRGKVVYLEGFRSKTTSP